jgi:hypothetical protein
VKALCENFCSVTAEHMAPQGKQDSPLVGQCVGLDSAEQHFMENETSVTRDPLACEQGTVSAAVLLANPKKEDERCILHFSHYFLGILDKM